MMTEKELLTGVKSGFKFKLGQKVFDIRNDDEELRIIGKMKPEAPISSSNRYIVQQDYGWRFDKKTVRQLQKNGASILKGIPLDGSVQAWFISERYLRI